MLRTRVWTLSPLLLLVACSSSGGDACALEDADGIIGGDYTFELRVDDATFEPIILTAQNSADISLTLVNQSTSDAGFRIDCLPTPNDDGCATESCFPDSHVVDPIGAGESETVTFRVPQVEGIYTFRTLEGDDTRTGQFIVQ